MAYAISSLLECPKRINPNEPHKSNLSYHDPLSGEFNKNENEQNLQDINNCLLENFWIAYDALDSNKKPLLELGIELAKEMQKALVNVGTALIDRRDIKIA